jgi:hypothetical protein
MELYKWQSCSCDPFWTADNNSHYGRLRAIPDIRLLKSLNNINRLDYSMGQQCFTKTDSNPPACGVHDSLLIETTINGDELIPGLGQITCFMCPVSEQVVNDITPIKRAKLPKLGRTG